jgi:hypothetical protein
MNEAIIGELIPVAAFVMVLGIVIVTTWVRAHYNSIDKARLHETVRMMVEKGQPVSSEMLQSLNVASNSDGRSRIDSGRSSDMRRGVTLVMVSFALIAMGFGFYYITDVVSHILFGVAAFPGFIGLGLIILALINRSAKPTA